jgi:hypothetical protein
MWNILTTSYIRMDFVERDVYHFYLYGDVSLREWLLPTFTISTLIGIIIPYLWFLIDLDTKGYIICCFQRLFINKKIYTYKACKFRKLHLQLNCTFRKLLLLLHKEFLLCMPMYSSWIVVQLQLILTITWLKGFNSSYILP